MAPGLLDLFTSIDDLLRQLIQESRDQTQALVDAIAGVTPPPPADNYLPFYSEGSLTVGTPITLLVKDDPEQGLGGVGRSGYIINDGVGSIYVLIYDGRVGVSAEVRIDHGEWLNIDRGDEIWVDKVTLRTNIDDTSYRCLFSR